MLEDLRTTERLLKTFLPSAYDQGGDLGPLKILSGALSVVFTQVAASENLSGMTATIRLLQEILPPQDIEGKLQDIHDNREEFHLYNFFGRADEFWRNRDLYATLPQEYRKQAVAEDLYRYKQQPLEDAPLAQRILASYVLSETEALREEQKKDKEISDRYFAHMLGDILPIPEFTEQHFTEQETLSNLGKGSKIIQQYRNQRPDETFSTFLVSKNYLPKTHLVAADMDTRTFRMDGVFFEGANFRASNMMRTQWDLSTTSIRGALFEGTDLRGAKGLTAEALADAYIDERTRLPAGIKFAAVMKLHERKDMPPAPSFTDTELKYMPKMA